jgi:hypothetical protein
MAACNGGHLHIAKWLFEVCDKKLIRASDGFGGSTCMHRACLNGHLDVAQWLFEVGAADDIFAIRSTGLAKNDATPLRHACEKGHLDTAKWLRKVGAAEGVLVSSLALPLYNICTFGHLKVFQWLVEELGVPIDTGNPDGCSYLHQASINSRHDIVTWMVVGGAASDVRGHVSAEVLMNALDIGTSRNALRRTLSGILADQSRFTGLFLPATHRSSSISEDELVVGRNMRRIPHNPLRLMRGYENSLLLTIGEFVGVLGGRKLRNAREASEALEVMHATAPMSDEEDDSDVEGYYVGSDDEDGDSDSVGDFEDEESFEYNEDDEEDEDIDQNDAGAVVQNEDEAR